MIITIGRKPFKGSMIQNIIENECGALNVDACRIGYGKSGPDRPHTQVITADKAFWGGVRGDNSPTKPRYDLVGRFPANLFLIHDEECIHIGTKRVKGNRKDTRPNGDGGRKDKSQWRFRPTDQTKRGFSNEDGLETVDHWDCVGYCSVFVLDKQSIARGIHSAGHAKAHDTTRSNGVATSFGGTKTQNTNGGRYGDRGGASRFFKVFKW